MRNDLGKNLLISIGIPFYNAEKYLALSIQSVLSQSYKNWELILLDDGSTDESLKIANSYAKNDRRIRVISDGENRKLPYRLNQLIKESRGEFIARMDADDLMHPDRLAKQFRFLEDNKKYDLVSSGLISIDNTNKVQGYRCVTKLYDDFYKPRLSYPIVHPSIMARKSWYERNKYSLEYPRAEDFELWTRAIINNDFKIAVLPDLLMFYREEGNIDLNKMLNSYSDILKIYSDYIKLKFFNKGFMKIKCKVIFIKILHSLGLLQKLAYYRNHSFSSENRRREYQELLLSIIRI